jgi:hypothetical protein
MQRPGAATTPPSQDRMASTAPAAVLPVLERLLLIVAPQWALRRARARAAHAAFTAQQELDRRHPENVRYLNGERWRRRPSGFWELDELPADRWQRR